MNIRVVKIIMGFKNKPYISKYLTPSEIDGMHKEILNLSLGVNNYSGGFIVPCNIDLGYQEGYFIQNIDDEPLDLSCVETDNDIKELKKYEITCLQLKSLIFLLFKNKQSLTIDNGKFYISNRKLFENNNLPLDIYLSNFYFEFDSVYKLNNKLSIWVESVNNIKFRADTRIPIFNNYLFLQIDNNTFNKNIKNYDYYWPKWGKTLLNDSKSLLFFNYIFNKSSKTKTLQKVIKLLVLPLNSTDSSLQHKFIYFLLPKKGDLDFSGYYKIASKTNHILGTYMKNGLNIYTTSKASSKYRNTDIETYYNGQTIKNPIEFNIPNAKGSISLILGSRFKEELIDNMNFGDLSFEKLEIAHFTDKIAKKLQGNKSELNCLRIAKSNCNIHNVIINCQRTIYDITGEIDTIKLNNFDNNCYDLKINNVYSTNNKKSLKFSGYIKDVKIKNLYIVKNKKCLQFNISSRMYLTIDNLLTSDSNPEASIFFNGWGDDLRGRIEIKNIDSKIKKLTIFMSFYNKELSNTFDLIINKKIYKSTNFKHYSTAGNIKSYLLKIDL